MAEQLTIFGLWERVEAERAAPPPPPDGEPELDPLASTGDRQCSLFSGPLSLRGALLAACEALDAPGVRARRADLQRRFPAERWADAAEAWAASIDRLVGAPAGSLGIDEQVERAVELLSDGVAAIHFPALPASTLGLVRAAALVRGATRLQAERGPLARTAGGEPAGWLMLQAGEHRGARAMLEAAAVAAERGVEPEGRRNTEPSTEPPHGQPDGGHLGRALSWLGEAAWRDGDRPAALHAFVRASLAGAALGEADITCQPILELLDAADEYELPGPAIEWVPALADLCEVARLPEAARVLPEDASAGRRLAAELASYRSARASGAHDEAARIEAKRRIARIAPRSLHELVRKI